MTTPALENLTNWDCEVRQADAVQGERILVHVKWHDAGYCGIVYVTPASMRGAANVMPEGELVPVKKHEEPQGTKSLADQTTEELLAELAAIRAKREQAPIKTKTRKETGSKAKPTRTAKAASVGLAGQIAKLPPDMMAKLLAKLAEKQAEMKAKPPTP